MRRSSMLKCTFAICVATSTLAQSSADAGEFYTPTTRGRDLFGVFEARTFHVGEAHVGEARFYETLHFHGVTVHFYSVVGARGRQPADMYFKIFTYADAPESEEESILNLFSEAQRSGIKLQRRGDEFFVRMNDSETLRQILHKVFRPEPGFDSYWTGYDF